MVRSTAWWKAGELRISRHQAAQYDSTSKHATNSLYPPGTHCDCSPTAVVCSSVTQIVQCTRPWAYTKKKGSHEFCHHPARNRLCARGGQPGPLSRRAHLLRRPQLCGPCPGNG